MIYLAWSLQPKPVEPVEPVIPAWLQPRPVSTVGRYSMPISLPADAFGWSPIA